MEQKKMQLYRQILDSSEEIRKEIMSNISDIILFGGPIAETDNKELSAIAKITGDTFQALIDKGIEPHDVLNKKDFVSITIGEKEYLCHTSVIPSFQKKNSFVDTMEEKKSTPIDTPVITKETHKEEVITEEIEASSDSISEKTVYEESIGDKKQSAETEVKNDLDVENTEIEKEDTIDENVVDGTIQEQNESASEDSNTEDSSIEENATEIDKKPEALEIIENENIEISERTDKKEEITTENTMTNISQFSRSNMFIEEKRKNFNEFIFDVHRISVMHNFGGKPEDMQVMIAPLKIQKYACTTVPILVSIYYKGRTYTKSSYDSQEDGKNLVQIDVNEYYFLCRGSFDDEGNFNSILLTTGPSANQGDKINHISKKKYGNSKRTNTNNGHIKFRYTADEGPGTIEVFPLDVGEQDFIIVTKNDEFIDYLAISPNGYNKPFLYEDGVKKEIICNWDNDTLEVELLEA